MAIFVTGDTHGGQTDGWLSVDGFMKRLNMSSFPEQKSLQKTDYVVICGDFGGVWRVSRTSVGETDAEKHALDWLESRSFTTLFVPGNHENYDRLTGCRNESLMRSWFYAKMPPEEKEKLKQGYPRLPWHGGFVRQVRPSVLMLENGSVFEIDGKSCFSFGGARSHDIRDGVLDPAAYPDEDAFKDAYKAKRGSLFRVRGVSWWAEEMPSREEMDAGKRNLADFLQRRSRIDYIFTHDGPASDKLQLGYEGVDELNRYLEEIKQTVPYGQWFFGHLHDNRRLSESDYLLYEQIVRIN